MGAEGLSYLQGHIHGPFVVGGTPSAHPASVDGEFERRAFPLVQTAGRLDIIVPIDEDGGRPIGHLHLAENDRIAIRLHHPSAGECQLPGDPLSCPSHRGRVRIATYTRDGDIFGQLGQIAAVVRIKGEHGHHRLRSSGPSAHQRTARPRWRIRSRVRSRSRPQPSRSTRPTDPPASESTTTKQRWNQPEQ